LRNLSSHRLASYAWAAGALDGEGSIGVYVNPDCSSGCKMSVTNTDPRMCLKFAELFGGKVRKYKERRIQIAKEVKALKWSKRDRHLPTTEDVVAKLNVPPTK